MSSMRLPLLPHSSIVALLLSSIGNAADREPVDFNHEIRPLISANCYHCHGPDEGSRKAKLRLDLREDALKDRDGVRAIVPGNPSESEMLFRVRSTDPDEVMPPPKEGHSLTEADVALLTRWIEEGAEYKAHWSFTKPTQPVPPTATRADGTPLAPIDAFIQGRLFKAGLTPSAEADPHTLLRRVTLDLTGLPPTPEETSAFIRDQSPDVYSNAVDHLLASPAYGERWARMWLDLARYADSTGYGSDKFRMNVWPYRDWVIGAFNRNTPYDQFTTEQLAGDLLSNPTQDQLAATAFHRNTMTNVEGGTIDEEYRVAAVKDRIATTAQVWTGLTMQCAQCHTHKFDPIAHKDYYSFFAIFNQTEDSDREDEEPKLALPTKEQKAATERLQFEIAALEAKLRETPPELEAEQHDWEAQMMQRVDWTVLEPTLMSGGSGVNLSRRDDGSVFVEGGGIYQSTPYTVEAQTPLKGITAFRLEALPDPALPGNGPGLANGKAVLSEFRVKTSQANPKLVSGRFIRVSVPGDGKILSLAEVEVFSGGENIARMGKATQSSIGYEGPPNLAIDGNTEGDFTKSKTTHTDNESNPWWELDLGREVPIERVALWNRTDAGHNTRLGGAKAVVLDANRQEISSLTLPSSPEAKTDFTSGAVGRVVAFQSASADFEQTDWTAAEAIDGVADDKSGWAFAPETGKAHAIIFEAAASLGDDETKLTVQLEQKRGENHRLGRFRISATSARLPIRELPPAIKAVLALEPTERDDAQRDTLGAYFRPLSKTLAEPYAQMVAKKKELAGINPVALPVLRELAGDRRRVTHLMNKGNYLTPGEKVGPALPAAFAAFLPPEQAQTRLDVARWLFHPENPLTARVTVNRFWAQLFGTGLVETEEDFGTQGALPTHPELLDWLATTFQAPKPAGLGWDVKALLKLIVTSKTYRQSSVTTAATLEKDARNRLLARYPRRRLEAEAVRDQALQISGLLSRKIGGPSVYPPQPAGLWKVAFNNGQNDYPTSEGEDRHRRAIYTFWRRTMPYPSLATFDAPSRESCTVRRIPTNTPLQAFVTMNDPVFVECSQALARRLLHEAPGDVDTRLRRGLELALGRAADENHVAALRQLLHEELAHFRTDTESAKKLATDPLGPLPEGADAAEMAAWTVVANVLLNLDGVLMKS